MSRFYGFTILLLAGMFFAVSCRHKQPKKDTTYFDGHKARMVNGRYDELLSYFPSLETKYTYKDSINSQGITNYYKNQTYFKKSTDQPFTGTITNNHWNDSLEAKGVFKDGKIQKLFTYYSNDHKKKQIVAHPKKTGDDYFIIRTWYYTGEPQSISNFNMGRSFYKNGKIKSTWDSTSTREFWQLGNLKVYCSYDNGRRRAKRQGKWKAWHKNGAPAIDGYYKDGKRDGKWTYRNSLGSLQKIVYYNNGKVDSTVTKS